MQRIFMTGLSGSGKSTVGKQTAQLLGWDFVDTDDLLSEKMELPVGQILVNYGEQRFRELETEVLIAAAKQERVVIAAGGGAVIAEGNRVFMHDNGLVVYLQVAVETAWQRVVEHMNVSGIHAFRPLLSGTDGQERLRDLYGIRRQWYEQARLHINADTLAPDILAREVVAGALVHGNLWSSSLTRKVIKLNLSTVSSQAAVEWGGLHDLPAALESFGFQKRVFIVTDSSVGQLYAEPLGALLEGEGLLPHIFTVPAGEVSKSFLWLQQIIDWLVENRAERKEPVIALGGGVVGDLVGFVASCYQRGVPLIQIPTTLLAQVDSAIGGKVGINHPLGKNLIGAYYQPEQIFVDPAFLLTLPERVYCEGWAEIVKYGMILDAELFEILEEQIAALRSRDAALLSAIVARCISLKMTVVELDEREGGLRAILNYGHTFGHALEAVTGYGAWLHGEAVSVGMEVAAQIAVAKGLLSREDALRQRRLLRALDLPISYKDIDIEAILAAMQRDKKVQAGHIRWILPTRIGHGEVYGDVPLSMVKDAIMMVANNSGGS